MTVSSLKILLACTWADGQVTRLWDGSGPYIDGDGLLWKSAALLTGIGAIEQAINGEATALDITMSGVSVETANAAWKYDQDGNITGAIVKMSLQACDLDDQPVGAPRVMLTAQVDNVIYQDTIDKDRPQSSVTFQITNRFTLRRLFNGAALSDADQRARSSVLNPGADPDTFAQRVPLMQNKTVVWPRWS